MIVSVGKLGKGVLLVDAEAALAEAELVIVGEEDDFGDLVNEDVLDDDEDALGVDVVLGEVCIVRLGKQVAVAEADGVGELHTESVVVVHVVDTMPLPGLEPHVEQVRQEV